MTNITFQLIQTYKLNQNMSENTNTTPQNANQNCPGPASQSAGKQASCQGCPNQQLCAEKKMPIDDSKPEIQQKLSNIKHKVLVLSGKGGVGKSTVATQLAITLASQGLQVGLLDVDICGPSVPSMLGLVGSQVHQSAEGWSPVYLQDNLAVMSIGFLLGNQNDAVIWRGPRKNGLIKQFLTEVSWGDLDYLIIDTPPGTSDEHLSLIQYLTFSQDDGAIIVTTPQQVALSDVRKQVSFCLKTKLRILGVVENMSGFVCPHCKCESQIFSPTSGGAIKMCQDYKIKLITCIPLDPKILSLIDKGKSILEDKQSEVAKRYSELSKYVVGQFTKQT